jgi:hypothetical protein
MSNALVLLQAIHEKTQGRGRAVRDVTELETGLTKKAARDAWGELLDKGLIERFNQPYAARLSCKGLDLISSGGPLPALKSVSGEAPSVVIARGADTAARLAVANYLAELHVASIALQGPGLIQKVEPHHNLSYAVVLLTAADLDPANAMHALMDVGYLIGRFGANRVRAFVVDAPPVELAGLAVHSFDAEGAWKQLLADDLLPRTSAS